MTSLAPILQAFFTDRLITQRRASPNTIAAYRDAFRLLLAFATSLTGKTASNLDIADIDADCVTGFLRHLEHERRNGPRSRNARLAAIRSLFSYAATRCPEDAATIQRVLAIPAAKAKCNTVTYLNDHEAAAFLTACNRATWAGRRDHAMFTLAIQTGLRISELTSLTVGDLHLGAGANIHCFGKGRKERHTPLIPHTVKVLAAWTRQLGPGPDTPLFPTSTGRALSRDAVEHRVKLTAARAAQTRPSLATKNVTAHTLRHTAAMRLLHAGVDITVIALWLGHEQITTTNTYLHADMTQKEEAIAKTSPIDARRTGTRYQADDRLLAFLDNL
jgi:site-specific recombinase XerD